MNQNEFEVIEQVKDYFTYYFIDSHLKSLHNEIEIVLETNHKGLKSIRKILDKEIRVNNGDYMISVYGIDFKPVSIKKKELKDINGISLFPIKICLKQRKNKFEAQNYSIDINTDNFIPFIKFEMQKKLFAKDILPPVPLNLTNLQVMQIFKEALTIRERIQISDATYEEFLKFGVNTLKIMPSYDLVLFLMLYVDILKGKNIFLIKEIFENFNLGKIIKPANRNDIVSYTEKFELLYNEQNRIVENIKKIPLCNLLSYLIKFYTIHINLYFTIESFDSCDRIMKDLRDNNPFDDLILVKLYLSEYSQFYRSIPISPEMKNSLMGKFISTSENYNNLVTSFSLISDYIQKDFVNTLLIITENYEKINEICSQSNSYIKINDYITLKVNDDLSKVQSYLDIIAQKKLEKRYKSINIDFISWDFYLVNNNNPNFLEYLKSHLVKGSLTHQELVESLLYLIRYTNKDFVEMLKIIVNNYDRIKEICMNERKQIIMNDLITTNVNDNQEKIKEYLTYISDEKTKDQYETINFNINIWKFYVMNKCNYEFLSFIEKKLYDSSLNSKEIMDYFDFSSNFRNKSFVSMLEIILYNIDKIIHIFKNEMKNIFIESYIIQQEQTDDLEKIYELIKEIIEKEKENTYCFVKFNANLWLPYSQTDKLEILKFIRKIIFECKIMEPELNEDIIQLAKKIHDVGFSEIQRGILEGEKLLQFLGEDEAFYVNKQINDCIQKNLILQNQVNTQANEIQGLKNMNSVLTNRIGILEAQVMELSDKTNAINGKLYYLEGEKNRLDVKIEGIKNEHNILDKKVKNYISSHP